MKVELTEKAMDVLIYGAAIEAASGMNVGEIIPYKLAARLAPVVGAIDALLDEETGPKWAEAVTKKYIELAEELLAEVEGNESE